MAAIPVVLRLLKGCSKEFARGLALVLALSLITSLCSVHASLAAAGGMSERGVTLSAPEPDHPGEPLELGHFAHLAGHLTCVIAPAVFVSAAQDAVLRPNTILADRLPLSSTLPAPSEPPRG